MNGKVERRQTDLIHKALAGMHQANLNEATRKALQNEAVNYANDTVNLMQSRTATSNPYVMMNRQRSRLENYVQPFGRIGQVTTTEKIKGKQSVKSVRMITYRMLNPTTNVRCGLQKCYLDRLEKTKPTKETLNYSNKYRLKLNNTQESTKKSSLS